MRKIRKILALLFMGSALSTMFAEGADIVVLMDSSGTILPWFDEINNRILVDITNKFVREGDTFHLVSFNSRVNLEIAQPVNSEADVSRIVSRFMLLYPLGQNSDFLSGLQYIWQYVSSLNQQREKIIIVISDGIFNPPASSPYASYTADQIHSEITQMSRKIRGAGWNVYYIKLPFPQNAEIRALDGNLLASTVKTDGPSGSSSETPSSGSSSETPSSGSSSGGTASSGTASKTNAAGGTDAQPGSSAPDGASAVHEYYDISSEFTSALEIEQSPLPESDVPITFIDQVFSIPQIQFPQDLGKKGRFFILPLKVKNNADIPLNMELVGVFIDDDVNVLSKNSFLTLSPRSGGTLRAEIKLPETILKGPQDIKLSLGFSDNLRVLPQSATVHMNITGFSVGNFFSTGSSILFSIIIILLAVVLVLFLFFFILRRTARPASDAIRTASSAEERKAAKAAAGESARFSGTHAIPAASSLAAASVSASVSTLAAASASASSAASERSILAEQKKDMTQARAASVLEQASPQHERQSIDYHTEKRVYPDKSAVTEPVDASQSLTDLSRKQLEEKRARIAILSGAAAKKPHLLEKRKGANENEHIEVKGTDRVMVELSVDNQNPNVGKRNIHMLKAGSRLSVGGGQSPFLVFLVKFPPRIAEIRYDGVNCALAILKPEYFPLEKEVLIHDCMDRTFTVVSDKDYEVTFSFRLYEDPVRKLNRLLTSIKY